MDASYVSVTPKIPQAWTKSDNARRFFEKLTTTSSALLMLDYDGTLSPFTEDRLQAKPYPGVRERLDQLAAAKRNRVVLISGRKARELQSLIALDHPIEIWGSHGREHLALDGRYSIEPLTEYEQAALDYLHGQLEAEYASQMLECKPNSLAVHWRGVEHRSGEVSSRMEQLYREFSENHQGIGKLQLLPFDGGVEFRVGDVHKGDAVRKMMNAMPENTFAAFLGDDTTDEDAFEVLRGHDYEARSLAVLVRSEPRDSFANIWLSPPDELLRFLDEWINATALAMDTL